MNIVNSIENNRYGISRKLCYEVALQRLMCVKENNSEMNNLPDSDAVPMACKFSRNKGTENILGVANEMGLVYIEKTDKRNDSMYYFNAHNNAIFDMAWCDVNNQLIVGSGDHTISMWDVGESSAKQSCVFSKHTSSVKTVCFLPDSKDVFASGGRDGCVMLWDSRNSTPNTIQIQPFNIIRNYNIQTGISSSASKRKKIKPGSHDSVSTVLFQNNTTLFSCTVGEGVIKVWDIRKFYSTNKRIPQALHILHHPVDTVSNCFTDLVLDPSGIRLYANCLDNTTYCYNVSTYPSFPVANYTGHKISSMFVNNSLSPDGCYLLSGSSDNCCYIWRTDRPGKPIMQLKGHESEVTCVDWSRSYDTKIATCADDMQIGLNSCRAFLWRTENINICDEFSSCKDTGTQGNNIEDIMCYGWTEIVNNSPKCQKPSHRYFSPIRIKKFDCDPAATALSPTLNLPNHVIDGTSPSHQCQTYSREKENSNWLLDLQSKKTPVRNKSSPKAVLKRLQSRKSKVRGNLFKFFPVVTKQN